LADTESGWVSTFAFRYPEWRGKVEDMKRRSLVVLLSVVVMMLATIAPAVAADVETAELQ
jgi:hypothetical protein